MNLIVAVTQDWGIGCENQLLIPISEDLKRFRSLTIGRVVVMGHNTFKSLPNGRPLKRRTNIVLSKDRSLAIPGVMVKHSVEDFLATAATFESDDIFVIGGQAIYTALLPYCKKAYITKIHATPKADTFFPNMDMMEDWRLAETSEVFESEGVPFQYCMYEKH